MWAWMKRFDNTDTSEVQELRKENRAMRLLVARALEASQALSQSQQESLDRVIAAKFDLPVIAHSIIEQPAKHFSMPMEHFSDVMAIEDDREFLEKAHGA